MLKQTVPLLALLCIAAGVARAATDPMIGDWKLDSSKSRLFDEMKVSSLGTNKFSFDFGAGQAEQIVIDGSDQPGLSGTTLAVTAVAPDQWKVVRKKDGRAMLTGIWTLSKDGNNLNDDYSEYGDDGKTTNHVVYTYERKGGGSGFDADWVSTSQQMETEYRVEVQPFETDGLSFTFPGERERSIKFDGKDHPNPNPAVKMVTTAQRVNATSVVLTDKFGDRVIDTQEIGVSTDGKTLTIIRHVSGRTEPDLFVFERN
jgi:hypothetical protein